MFHDLYRRPPNIVNLMMAYCFQIVTPPDLFFPVSHFVGITSCMFCELRTSIDRNAMNVHVFLTKQQTANAFMFISDKASKPVATKGGSELDVIREKSSATLKTCLEFSARKIFVYCKKVKRNKNELATSRSMFLQVTRCLKHCC